MSVPLFFLFLLSKKAIAVTQHTHKRGREGGGGGEWGRKPEEGGREKGEQTRVSGCPVRAEIRGPHYYSEPVQCKKSNFARGST